MDKKELIVEYFPMKSEEMITDFYFGDYDTLVLDSDGEIYYDCEGAFLAVGLLILKTN